jgi:hypothetical protein
VTNNLWFVSHPAVWHNRAALASLMAENLADFTTRQNQARLAELTNDWRATLRSGSLCCKALRTCRSEIVMDLKSSAMVHCNGMGQN